MLRSFSWTFFKMDFSTTSCVIPTAISWEEVLCMDTEDKDGVAEEELGGPGRKERKGWPCPVRWSTRFHGPGGMHVEALKL